MTFTDVCEAVESSSDADDLPPWNDPVPSFKVNVDFIMAYIRFIENQRQSSSNWQCDIAGTSKIIYSFYPKVKKIEKYKESAYQLIENKTIITGKEEEEYKSHYFVYAGNGHCKGKHFWCVKVHRSHSLDKIGVHSICDTNWESFAYYGWPELYGSEWSEVHPDSYSSERICDWSQLGGMMVIVLNCNEWNVKYYVEEKVDDIEFELQCVRKHRIKSNETYYFAMSICSKKHVSCYEMMEIPTILLRNEEGIKQSKYYQEFGRIKGDPVTISIDELLSVDGPSH